MFGYQIKRIAVDNLGEMRIDMLEQELIKLKDHEHLNFIVSCNFGTTFHAGFDNVPEIKKVIQRHKKDQWTYGIHLDAANYGPVFQQLKPHNFDINEVDTCAISLYKILGIPLVSGIAIANRSFLE